MIITREPYFRCRFFDEPAGGDAATGFMIWDWMPSPDDNPYATVATIEDFFTNDSGGYNTISPDSGAATFEIYSIPQEGGGSIYVAYDPEWMSVYGEVTEVSNGLFRIGGSDFSGLM